MKDLDRHFSKDGTLMAKGNMRRCSSLLVIKEIQIKTTMKYHLTPIRMATTKTKQNETENNKYQQRCGEIGTPECRWWAWKNSTAAVENRMVSPQNN